MTCAILGMVLSVLGLCRSNDNSIFLQSTTSTGTHLVIFVHGFIGDYESTWGEFPKLIQQDTELKGFDLFLWGYPSAVLARNPGVRQLGDQLKTELNERFAKYESIFLVGHSLGGLVIASMIIEQLKAGHAENLKRIKHIVLFGTPNQGAQIPSLLKIANRQLHDLANNAEIVDDIRNEWIDRVYRPEIRAGDENSKLRLPVTVVIGLQDQWVTERSARSFFRDPDPQTVQGDHVSMKQPTSAKHTSFLLLKNRLLSRGAGPTVRAAAGTGRRLPLTAVEDASVAASSPIPFDRFGAWLTDFVLSVKDRLRIDESTKGVMLHAVNAENVSDDGARTLVRQSVGFFEPTFKSQGLYFERFFSEKGNDIIKTVAALDKIIDGYDKKIRDAAVKGNSRAIEKLEKQRLVYIGRRDKMNYDRITDVVPDDKIPIELAKSSILLSTDAREMQGGRSSVVRLWLIAKKAKDRSNWGDAVTIEYVRPAYQE